MPLSAPSPAAPTLDALYALIKADLNAVDALLLKRMQSDVPLISRVASHIIASGGKRIRPALTLISSQLCGAFASPRAIGLATAVECIHTATLLHDDVVDESLLRRTNPTANAIFGNKPSILVGDYLFTQAFQLMVEDGSLDSLKILSAASATIVQGEVMQMACEGEVTMPQATYLAVIHAKTAALFAAACEVGAVVAGKPEYAAALNRFGEQLGMAFQIVDDALDYSANQTTLGKTVGDDFREGKMTLPVLLAYAAGSAEEKTFWARTMGEQQQTEGDLDHALTLLSTHKAMEKSLNTALAYAQAAKSALAHFPPCPAKSAMLDLVDFCVSRGY